LKKNKNKDNFDIIIYFHILLACLYWNLNNIDSLKYYYNKLLEYDKTLQLKNYDKKSFENIYSYFTNIPLIIYNSNTFIKACKISYADCVETAFRNLINIICYNVDIFDYKILKN
jgi:hypothetical protein